MRFKYIDLEGTEREVADLEGLVDAIRRGRVGPDTLLFDADRDRWAPAGQHDAYRVAALSESRSTESGSDTLPAHAATGTDPPPPEPDATPARGPGVLGRRPAQVAFTIAVVALAIWRTPGQGLAYSFGGVLGVFLLPALAMAWSRRARPYIPFAALLVSLVSIFGELGDRSRTRAAIESDVAGLRSLAEVVFDTTALDLARLPPVRDASALIGATLEERAVWVARAWNQNLVVHADSLRREFGVAEVLDEDWLSSRYLADAGSYPEVEEWCTASLSFVEHYRGTVISYLRASLDDLAVQARLGDAVREAMWRGGRVSLEEEILGSDGVMGVSERFLVAVCDLHRLLVEADPRAHYDEAEDLARFGDDTELDRAQALLNRVETLGALVELRMAESAQRIHAVLDSAARAIR